jgi:hypothetical protein
MGQRGPPANAIKEGNAATVGPNKPHLPQEFHGELPFHNYGNLCPIKTSIPPGSWLRVPPPVRRAFDTALSASRDGAVPSPISPARHTSCAGSRTPRTSDQCAMRARGLIGRRWTSAVVETGHCPNWVSDIGRIHSLRSFLVPSAVEGHRPRGGCQSTG